MPTSIVVSAILLGLIVALFVTTLSLNLAVGLVAGELAVILCATIFGTVHRWRATRDLSREYRAFLRSQGPGADADLVVDGLSLDSFRAQIRDSPHHRHEPE